MLVAIGFTVRSAVPADAADIAACHVACWRESYSHLLSAAFLDAMDVEARRERWLGALEGPVEYSIAVGLVGEEVVGLAAAGPGWDDAPVRDLTLGSLYVRAAVHGSGLGQALLDATVGDRHCSLWVATGYPRAIAFYLRNGFAPDGTVRREEPWEGLEIMRMVR